MLKDIHSGKERPMNEVKVQQSGSTGQQGSAPPPASATRPENLWNPFAALRTEMDRVFDNFWQGLGMGAGRQVRRTAPNPEPLSRFETSFGLAVPAIDVTEAEKEYHLTAELPGMEARDIDVALADDVLTIRGEKKEEREEKAESYCISERRFGAFQRSIQLPRGVDTGCIEAKFDKGLLTVILPKTAEAAARQKKIEVRQGS
jgi:HSP20 family protein